MREGRPRLKLPEVLGQAIKEVVMHEVGIRSVPAQFQGE
jgi:hypothetical protein